MTDNRTNEPSDEQVEAAARALYANKTGSELGFEHTLFRRTWLQSARIALVAAAPIPQPVLDLEKVAAVIDREFDDYQPMYPADGSRCIDSNAARALCEAAKRGELS